MMGNWEAALGSAELVLQKQPKDAKAILIKAEALFNLCEFEHALLQFYRGQVRPLHIGSVVDQQKDVSLFLRRDESRYCAEGGSHVWSKNKDTSFS